MSDCDPNVVPEYVAMAAILACVCAQLEVDGLPPVCVCTLQPGAVAYDFGTCDHADGMAWVAPASAYPSTQFPQPNLLWEPCTNSSNIRVIGLSVGIVRTLPLTQGPADQWYPTSAETWTGATQLQMLDMHSLRKAMTCCSDYDIVLQSWLPEGPAGGVVGGIWTVLVAAD